MTENPSIAIETVLDWAYCEAKVWWQTVGRSIEEEADNLVSPRTGSILLQEAIQGILKLGYQSHQKGNDFEYPTLRKLNGSIYKNPTWSHRWRDLAISTGLTDLRKEIDAEQHKAGLGKIKKDKNTDIWKEPIGLADAFARSNWIVENNRFPLEEILGVGEEVYVFLPHITVGVTPELILLQQGELIYEKHYYGIRPPRMTDLIGDYSIKALFSANQKDSDRKVSSIYVRHLMSATIFLYLEGSPWPMALLMKWVSS
jgi:hypothetical protein